VARIATGHYDAIIVSFRSFEYLPLSDNLFKRFLDEELAEIEDELTRMNASDGDNRRIVKQLETAKKRLKVRFEKRANREMKDDAVTFEDLGISQLSKAFDNSDYAQRRFMRSISSEPTIFPCSIRISYT
jgi:hypothetical protein